MEYVMGQDIKDAIEKNLPQAVGNVLRTRLEQADKDAAEVKRLTERLNGKIAELDTALNDLKKHKSLTEREESLAARVAEVSKRESAAALNELRVGCANEKVVLMQDLVKTVFSNPTLKYREKGTVPAGVGTPSSPGGYNCPVALSTEIDKTTEITTA